MKGSQAKARAYALRLLGYRPRSRREMLRKLEGKGFEKEYIDDTMRFLERSRLLNDELLASELIRYATERKSLGKKGVKMFLMKRGIDGPLIERALLDHSGAAEEETAREFAEKKIRSMTHCSEQTIKRRLGGMLYRRGYTTEVIYKTVHSIKL